MTTTLQTAAHPGAPAGSPGLFSTRSKESLPITVAHTSGASILQVVLAVLTTSLLARALGPAGKGRYDICLATAQLFYTCLAFSLPAGITYIVASGHRHTHRLAWLGYGWAGVQTLTTYIVLHAIQTWGLLRTLVPPELGEAAILLVSLTVGITTVAAWNRSILIGLHAFLRANMTDVLRPICGITLIIVIAVVASGSVTLKLVLLFLTANAAAGAIAGFFYQRGIRPQTSPRDVAASREVVRYCLPAFTGDVFQFLNYRFGLFAVSYWAGVGSVGLLQSAAFVSQALWLFPQALAAVIFPITISATARREDTSQLNATSARIALWLSIACGSALAATAPLFVPMFFGARFYPAVQLLWLLLPGSVIFSLSKVLASFLGGIGQPKWNCYGSAVGAAVTVLLALVLVPKYGARGAAVATTASHICNSAVLTFAFGRHTRVPLRRILVLQGEDIPRLKLLAVKTARGIGRYA